MKLDGTFLRSRVARRIFALFLISALIPAAGIAFLSIRQVDELLLGQKQAELTMLSKANSMALYERLLLLEDMLQQLAPELLEPGARDADLKQRTKGKFSSLALLRADGTAYAVSGAKTSTVHALTEDERRHLAEGKTLLFAVNGDGRLYCSSPATPPLLDQLARADARSARHLQWTDKQVRYLAGYYRMLLKPKFFVHGWTLIVSQPESEALATISAFPAPPSSGPHRCDPVGHQAERHTDSAHARAARAPDRRHAPHRCAALRRTHRDRSS